MNGSRLRQALLAMTSATLLAVLDAGAAPLAWSRLAPLPDAEGFAGMFAGVSGGALVAAGGANIVGDRWADPLQKRWYDSVFVLDHPDGQWAQIGRLPHACAYGVSVTTPDGIACIGGGDASGCTAAAFLLSLRGGVIRAASLPPLPVPAAYACGALVGRTIYVAGGISAPDAPALRRCWALDLDAKSPAWSEIAPWPGPARQKAVAGVQGGTFFLFGGAATEWGADGKLSTTFLKDAYAYTPGKGWTKRAGLPFAAAAAPSPAVVAGSELLIVGGDDGSHADFQPPRDHPGFSRRVLAYSVPDDRWSVAGEAPFSRVTVPAVAWGAGVALLSGEVRPRVRTPEVCWLSRP